MRQTRLFEILASDDTLVVALPRAGPVVSWAHLHGGLRSHVRHILIHRVGPQIRGESIGTALRRAVSRTRLPGTVVGMCTCGNITDYGLSEAIHEELHVAVLCTASLMKLATVGERGTYVETSSGSVSSSAIHLVLATNYRMTHEAMLEAMGIATEAKALVLYELDLQNITTGQRATGSSMDCVAVTCGHDRHYGFAGKSTKWGELVGQASIGALRTAIQKALLTVNQTSPVPRVSARVVSGR